LALFYTVFFLAKLLLSRGDLEAELKAAWESKPPPIEAPEGLVEVAQKAMQRLPENRYATVSAFQEAIEDWTVIRLVEAALIRREPEEASARLAELHRIPEKLQAKVEESRQEVAKEVALVKRLDRHTGAFSRRLVTIVLGLVFSLSPLVLAVTESSLGLNAVYPVMLLMQSGFLAGIGLCIRLFQEPLLKTNINRDSLMLLIAGFSSQLLLDAGFWWRGLDPRLAIALHLLLLTAVCATGVFSIHRRMIGAVLAFGLGFLVAMVDLSLAYWISSLVGAVFSLGIIRSWLIDCYRLST
jgi:hypothetical protein